MLSARTDGWLHPAERQVGKLCLREHAMATPGKILQAEAVVPGTLLRTLLCLNHVMVRLVQDFISDERREKGVEHVWLDVGLISVREQKVGGHLHGVHSLIIIRAEGTKNMHSDGL